MCIATTMGTRSAAGKDGSKRVSASTPPAEAPSTTSSARSSVLLVDALIARDLLEGGALLREAQALLGAEAEEPTTTQGLVEELQGPLLQIAVEVDEDVAAGDELHLRE